MKQLAKAVLKVMEEVKGIDKSMQVGSGRMAYKGVPDQEVKKIIGRAMEKNGLVMLPISVDPTTQVSRWEEADYNGQVKSKQSVFTEVKTKYLLLHESGESVELAGYGHGVDSQDKGAGKATTYALKYAMLYAFMVPTGKIDDADTDHSENQPVPQKQPVKKTKQSLTDERFTGAVGEITNGNYTIEALEATFSLTKGQQAIIDKMKKEGLNEK